MIKHIVFWKMQDFAEGNPKDKNMEYLFMELTRNQKGVSASAKPLLPQVHPHGRPLLGPRTRDGV